MELLKNAGIYVGMKFYKSLLLFIAGFLESYRILKIYHLVLIETLLKL
jgi:hypothetical protein